jgi:hypothetical protein
METKYCDSCRTRKDLDEFSPKNFYCKVCRTEMNSLFMMEKLLEKFPEEYSQCVNEDCNRIGKNTDTCKWCGSESIYYIYDEASCSTAYTQRHKACNTQSHYIPHRLLGVADTVLQE